RRPDSRVDPGRRWAPEPCLMRDILPVDQGSHHVHFPGGQLAPLHGDFPGSCSAAHRVNLRSHRVLSLPETISAAWRSALLPGVLTWKPVPCRNPAHGLTWCFTLGARAHSPRLPVHGPGV